MSTVESVQSIELRVRRAAAMISLQRSQLQEQKSLIETLTAQNQTQAKELDEAKAQIVDVDALKEQLQTEIELKNQEAQKARDNQLLQDQIDALKAKVEELEEQNQNLQKELELVQMHNNELQEYADTYKEDTKLIEASVARSIETLDSIEGLDDIALDDAMEVSEAEDFTGGEVQADLDISEDDLFV